MDEPVQPEVYVPLAQQPQNPMTFVVRTGAPADAALAAARTRVRGFDKDLVLTDATTLEGVVEKAVDGQRFRTIVFTAFASLAVLLAALGAYGVLAYFVAERTGEIGVRVALGASPAAIWAMVVGHGMKPVVLGMLCDLVFAVGAARLIRALLFGVVPLDPVTYLVTAAALATVGLAACAIPAFRAVRVDPLVALRQK
jgi:putative ABC transport system permease protein